MATIKEYNNKLKSLKNTQKITKTMKMVSASKLRKAQQAQNNAKIYARKITELTSRISNAAQGELHPLLHKIEKPKTALILVFTSDKGLCGAFNNNAHKHVMIWINQNKRIYDKIDISCCGKRGFMFFQKEQNVKSHYDNVTVNPNFSDAQMIADDLIQAFISKEYDEIYFAYNEFLSPLSQKTLYEKLLPIDPSVLIHEEQIEKSNDYIYEPEVKTFLNYLIPSYVYFKIYFALLENSAGEHGARMTAMDNATKNASELIGRYTLLRNRARQAAITTELIEIVAGAEAL